MKRNLTFLFVAFAFIGFPLSTYAASISIVSLSPGTSVLPKKLVTFKLFPVGFSSAIYQITDSFGATSVTSSNIDGGGNFTWVPVVSDVGTHTFTITARDNDGNVANITQAITVLPAPSVSIQSVSATQVMPGTPFTFSIVANGFTNPSFVVSDDVGGSGIDSTNISGTTFSWTPVISNNGKHRITIYASDSTGSSASASVDVQVGKGPQLLIQMTSTSTTVSPGTAISFVATPSQFVPTGFSVSDSFPRTTITNSNINTSGAFWWTPQASDVGVHVLTIRGQVGAFGDVGTTTTTLTVLGPGGTLPAPTAATSSETLLSTLKAQLAALMAKATSASPSVSAPTLSRGQSFTLNLKPGSKGDEVLRLQHVLKGLGLLSATPNGYYGVGTTAAVKAFQAAHGLDQLGSVGPGTRAALNALDATSAVPSTGATSSGTTQRFVFQHFMGYGDDDAPDVTELQKYLQAKGYLSDTVAFGFYGSATESAVKKFQSAKGIAATGYVDSATRVFLNQ